ncbi:uncharacterized protein LOC144362684 [Saccoglossus kowalevskii]
MSSDNNNWREEFRDLGWHIADKARFHAVSHHISADWYERLNNCLTYTSVILGSCSTIGAGSLLTDYVKENPDHKNTAILVAAATGIIQAAITTLNSSEYAPKKLRDDHLKAAVELQEFREKLKVWYRVDINNPDMTVDMTKKDYDRFLDTKKKIESDFIKSENWTWKKVNFEISHSDNRRDKAKKKEL